ncbi:NUDIX domain-containing protein [Paenibacillus sp. FSL R5-0519]|uniref:NUDIX domain-containing protein n=1 Tax=Paenibacillus sp. FSL R5-0519 TaxID=2921648 RepID=UPI0030DA4434
MSQWFDLDELDPELIKFAVIIAKYNHKFIIIKNRKRGGWEIPGGNKEIGETILHTASRELYEETGAVHFELTPYGVYEWNGSFGMVSYAEVILLGSLPYSEIDEILLVDVLPEGMNFGDMFYHFLDRWDGLDNHELEKYTIQINHLNELPVIKIS